LPINHIWLTTKVFIRLLQIKKQSFLMIIKKPNSLYLFENFLALKWLLILQTWCLSLKNTFCKQDNLKHFTCSLVILSQCNYLKTFKHFCITSFCIQIKFKMIVTSKFSWTKSWACKKAKKRKLRRSLFHNELFRQQNTSDQPQKFSKEHCRLQNRIFF